MKRPLRERSALVYVLIALIPYSKPNLLLAYKPALFFRELEKISKFKEKTLRAAYARVQRQGLIEEQKNLIRLTAKGKHKVMPFVAKNLDGLAYLMVIFDIPEDKINTRRKFRLILIGWNFRQVQKSVWMTGKDLRNEVVDVVKEMDLGEYVQIYESARLFPK